MFSNFTSIPKYIKTVFIADLFSDDYVGGAELTTDAFLKYSPSPIYKIHSHALTAEAWDRIEKPNKKFVFFNWANLPFETVCKITDESRYGLNYSIVEYDFKLCKYRSYFKHKQETKTDCNCSENFEGLIKTDFYQSAKNILWMSEKQKLITIEKTPKIKQLFNGNHHIQSSTFDFETLDKLKKLKENTKKNDKFAILGSGSWIKGIQETEQYCLDNKINYEKIPNLPYSEFIKKLAEYKGFIFMPLDYDTCPRTVIEAKLLGCELILNENVLHKDEDWFKDRTSEDVEKYLRTRPENFWQIMTNNF